LSEYVFETDRAEEFGPSLRRVFHAIEMFMELIDVLTSILVAFSRITIDWRMTGINDALNKGHMNIVLINLLHRESRVNANNVRIVTKEFGLNVHGGCIVASSSLKRKKAEHSSTSHSVILGHSSVLGTGRPAPLPGMPSNRRSRQGHSAT
jgi:hypothetical protein